MYQNLTAPLTDLVTYYDVTDWWRRDNPLQIMVEAILIQNTNNQNVAYAIENLKPYLTDGKTLAALPMAQLEEAIKPSGFFHVKAVRLHHFLDWFATYDYQIKPLKQKPKADLRKELLAINGIGPETADDLLLYVFEQPVFIGDKYARRLFSRLGFALFADYTTMHNTFEPILPTDIVLAKAWHSSIVVHSQTFCKAKPLCADCPLLPNCEYGQKVV